METTQENAQGNSMSIGKRIAALRKAAGMTQEQLAERLGVTPQAVSKWENDISCPDIGMLPRIAEVFGVTTDALLGRETLDTQGVAAAHAYTMKQARRGDRGGLWFGVIVVVTGLALLYSQFAPLPFALWPVVWSAVLLGVGVAWMLKRFSFLNLGIALLGLYFLLQNLGAQLPFTLSWSLGIPVFVILLGLTVLWDYLFPRKYDYDKKWDHPEQSEFARKHAESSFSDADGYVHMRTSFAEDTCTARATLLKGGEFNVHFGHAVLDLRAVADIAPDAALRVDISFGEGELWLPRTLRAEVNMSRSVGDVQTEGGCNADAKPLLLSGSVSFGALSIHYI